MEKRDEADTERNTFLYRSARSTQKLLVMSSVEQNQKAVQWVISFLIFGDERKERKTGGNGRNSCWTTTPPVYKMASFWHRLQLASWLCLCVCVWPCACIDKSPYYASATVFEFHHYGETRVVLFAAVSFGI